MCAKVIPGRESSVLAPLCRTDETESPGNVLSFLLSVKCYNTKSIKQIKEKGLV